MVNLLSGVQVLSTLIMVEFLTINQEILQHIQPECNQMIEDSVTRSAQCPFSFLCVLLYPLEIAGNSTTDMSLDEVGFCVLIASE